MNNVIRAAIGMGAKTLRANQTSWLKRMPIQSSELPSDQKIQVVTGFEIPVDNVIIVDGHYQFDSTDMRFFGRGYAFAEHFEFVGEVVEATPELVTQSQAIYIFENAVTDELFKDLNEGLQKFGITDKEDIRQFLAQCAHESGGLKWLKEFATGDDYEWREDLGNNQAGDGRKFKGGGAIQLTGRANYQGFADFIGDPEIMNQGVDYVAEHYPISSAGFWWYNNNMSDFVASGATCRQVSARVNGWDPANGLADRIYYYERAKEVI